MLSVASVAALTAVIATVCTLAAVHFTQPEVVQAQKPERAGTQIALVNLELLSRRSPLFAKDRDKWVKAKAQLDEHRKSLEDKYEELKAKVRRSADSEDLLMLKVELQSYEESIKACRQQHQDYLAALLDQYQREVLADVMTNVKRYADQQGFDLVLQTYSLGSADPEFFSGGSYAQDLMSQAALYAPGAADGQNAHVVDITDTMIGFMRDGGVPEKK